MGGGTRIFMGGQRGGGSFFFQKAKGGDQNVFSNFLVPLVQFLLTYNIKKKKKSEFGHPTPKPLWPLWQCAVQSRRLLHGDMSVVLMGTCREYSRTGIPGTTSVNDLP